MKICTRELLSAHSHLFSAIEYSRAVISFEALRFDGNIEKHTFAKQLGNHFNVSFRSVTTHTGNYFLKRMLFALLRKEIQPM